MKLFSLTRDGNPTVLTFLNKRDAKAKRDELNGGCPAECIKQGKPVRYTVTFGEDHDKA